MRASETHRNEIGSRQRKARSVEQYQKILAMSFNHRNPEKSNTNLAKSYWNMITQNPTKYRDIN